MNLGEDVTDLSNSSNLQLRVAVPGVFDFAADFADHPDALESLYPEILAALAKSNPKGAFLDIQTMQRGSARLSDILDVQSSLQKGGEGSGGGLREPRLELSISVGSKIFGGGDGQETAWDEPPGDFQKLQQFFSVENFNKIAKKVENCLANDLDLDVRGLLEAQLDECFQRSRSASIDDLIHRHFPETDLKKFQKGGPALLGDSPPGLGTLGQHWGSRLLDLNSLLSTQIASVSARIERFQQRLAAKMGSVSLQPTTFSDLPELADLQQQNQVLSRHNSQILQELSHLEALKSGQENWKARTKALTADNEALEEKVRDLEMSLDILKTELQMAKRMKKVLESKVAHFEERSVKSDDEKKSSENLTQTMPPAIGGKLNVIEETEEFELVSEASQSHKGFPLIQRSSYRSGFEPAKPERVVRRVFFFIHSKSGGGPGARDGRFSVEVLQSGKKGFHGLESPPANQMNAKRSWQSQRIVGGSNNFSAAKTHRDDICELDGAIADLKSLGNRPQERDPFDMIRLKEGDWDSKVGLAAAKNITPNFSKAKGKDPVYHSTLPGLVFDSCPTNFVSKNVSQKSVQRVEKKKLFSLDKIKEGLGQGRKESAGNDPDTPRSPIHKQKSASKMPPAAKPAKVPPRKELLGRRIQSLMDKMGTVPSQYLPAMEVLGQRLHEALGRLTTWREIARQSKGYQDIAAAGTATFNLPDRLTEFPALQSNASEDSRYHLSLKREDTFSSKGDFKWAARDNLPPTDRKEAPLKTNSLLYVSNQTFGKVEFKKEEFEVELYPPPSTAGADLEARQLFLPESHPEFPRHKSRNEGPVAMRADTPLQGLSKIVRPSLRLPKLDTSAAQVDLSPKIQKKQDLTPQANSVIRSAGDRLLDKLFKLNQKSSHRKDSHGHLKTPKFGSSRKPGNLITSSAEFKSISALRGEKAAKKSFNGPQNRSLLGVAASAGQPRAFPDKPDGPGPKEQSSFAYFAQSAKKKIRAKYSVTQSRFSGRQDRSNSMKSSESRSIGPKAAPKDRIRDFSNLYLSVHRARENRSVQSEVEDKVIRLVDELAKIATSGECLTEAGEPIDAEYLALMIREILQDRLEADNPSQAVEQRSSYGTTSLRERPRNKLEGFPEASIVQGFHSVKPPTLPGVDDRDRDSDHLLHPFSVQPGQKFTFNILPPTSDPEPEVRPKSRTCIDSLHPTTSISDAVVSPIDNRLSRCTLDLSDSLETFNQFLFATKRLIQDSEALRAPRKASTSSRTDKSPANDRPEVVQAEVARIKVHMKVLRELMAVFVDFINRKIQFPALSAQSELNPEAKVGQSVLIGLFQHQLLLSNDLICRTAQKAEGLRKRLEEVSGFASAPKPPIEASLTQSRNRYARVINSYHFKKIRKDLYKLTDQSEPHPAHFSSNQSNQGVWSVADEEKMKLLDKVNTSLFDSGARNSFVKSQQREASFLKSYQSENQIKKSFKEGKGGELFKISDFATGHDQAVAPNPREAERPEEGKPPTPESAVYENYLLVLLGLMETSGIDSEEGRKKLRKIYQKMHRNRFDVKLRSPALAPVFQKADETLLAEFTPHFQMESAKVEPRGSPRMFRKSSTSKCLKEPVLEKPRLDESGLTWRRLSRMEGTELLPETPRKSDMTVVTEKIHALTHSFQEISYNQSKLEQLLTNQEATQAPVDFAAEIGNLHSKLFKVQADIDSLKAHVLKIETKATPVLDLGGLASSRPSLSQPPAKTEAGDSPLPFGSQDEQLRALTDELWAQKQQVKILVAENYEKEQKIEQLIGTRSEKGRTTDLYPKRIPAEAPSRDLATTGKKPRLEHPLPVRTKYNRNDLDTSYRDPNLSSFAPESTRFRKGSTHNLPHTLALLTKQAPSFGSAKR